MQSAPERDGDSFMDTKVSSYLSLQVSDSQPKLLHFILFFVSPVFLFSIAIDTSEDTEKPGQKAREKPLNMRSVSVTCAFLLSQVCTATLS